MSLSYEFTTPKSRTSTSFFPLSTAKTPEKWQEYEFFKVFIRIRNFPSLSKSDFIMRKINSSMVSVFHLKEKKDFSFDYVFEESETTRVIFTKAVQPALEGIFQGFNSTIMAYGMTGSGKTFTMFGEISDVDVVDQNPGLIYLAVKDIFWKIHLETAMDPNLDFVLQMNYLEIYNEQIRDLLSESSLNLQILEDPMKGPIVQGMIDKPIRSPQEIISLINAGNTRRVVAETTNNKFSSRSHVLLILTLQKKHRLNEPNKMTYAKLVMADLAGSERACISSNKGLRMLEGGNINRSLLALGNCIKMLSEKAHRINYRDSKLTRLLKESLGGNTRTIMLACLSPLQTHYEESMNTLKYASRMRQIKVRMSRNIREEVMDMQMAIKIDHEHKMNSLNSFSQNLMLNLEELIEINKELQDLHREKDSDLYFLKNEQLSIEKRTKVENSLKENSLRIQDYEQKFKEKCSEKQQLFMRLVDQLGINAVMQEKNKDIKILQLNREIERLKHELKEKDKILQKCEIPTSSVKKTQHSLPFSDMKIKKETSLPTNITEIRKYYKHNQKIKFHEDLYNGKKLQNNKRFVKSKHKTTFLQPTFMTKYQEFKASYKEKETHSNEKNKKRLPVSDLSSIHNEKLSIDSLIFDKDIDEHENGIIELRNFVKKDSKLKMKNEKTGNYSPPLRSLNTTQNLNVTQKLFNEGYYSEEIEHARGRRKMYKSVRDLIKRQREHLDSEYKKLNNANSLKSWLMFQNTQTLSNINEEVPFSVQIKHC